MDKQVKCIHCMRDTSSYYVFVANKGPLCRVCATIVMGKETKNNEKPDPRYTT